MPDTPPIVSNPEAERLEDTLALCLSGGGYRAMLFHLGVLQYFNDAPLLGKLDRISSVSGGSITAGVLAMQWNTLVFDTAGHATNFDRLVTANVRKMAATTVDVGAVILGALLPGTIGDRVIKRYREVLFGDKTLQDLPDRPRFVINATNVQTGSLFRFSKPYIGDWRIGRFPNPDRLLAEAVAASSAFPPILSPARLSFKPTDFSLDGGACNTPKFTANVLLTDGGVYDNMGIETAWKRCKTIFVSDAGAKMQPESDTKTDTVRHSLRVNSVIDNQVRSLRRRQVVNTFINGERKGAFWAMSSNPADFPAPSALAVPLNHTQELAAVSTRLSALNDEMQERLINFGYAMAERGVRSHFDPAAFAPVQFPYPRGV
ncbi:MAG TPA: patatin-like phospholipase family protein [Thermoanaerobaculia bacterium]|jgi:NTE family protein|nr:patatin-like phospholipase family protein [Thermoanaerobaculia bacterium]